MNTNKHNLLCIECGRPLVLGRVDVRRNRSTNFGLTYANVSGTVGTASTGGPTYINALTCPNNHNYYLVEVKFDISNILFYGNDLLRSFVENEGSVAAKYITTTIKNGKFSAYAINYGMIEQYILARALDNFRVMLIIVNRTRRYRLYIAPRKRDGVVNVWEYPIISYEVDRV